MENVPIFSICNTRSICYKYMICFQYVKRSSFPVWHDNLDSWKLHIIQRYTCIRVLMFSMHCEAIFLVINHTVTGIHCRNLCSLSWASCQISNIAGAHAPGMPGTLSPSPQVSDPDMHHGTCVTHVPWCMPESLTCGFLWNRQRGKTFPAFPAHAQPAILRIW